MTYDTAALLHALLLPLPLTVLSVRDVRTNANANANVKADVSGDIDFAIPRDGVVQLTLFQYFDFANDATRLQFKRAAYDLVDRNKDRDRDIKYSQNMTTGSYVPTLFVSPDGGDSVMVSRAMYAIFTLLALGWWWSVIVEATSKRGSVKISKLIMSDHLNGAPLSGAGPGGAATPAAQPPAYVEVPIGGAPNAVPSYALAPAAGPSTMNTNAAYVSGATPIVTVVQPSAPPPETGVDARHSPTFGYHAMPSTNN